MTEGESITSSRRAALTHPAQLATPTRKEVSANAAAKEPKGLQWCVNTRPSNKGSYLARLPHHFHQLLTECGQLNFVRQTPEEPGNRFNFASCIGSGGGSRRLKRLARVLERRQDEHHYSPQSEQQQQFESMTGSAAATNVSPSEMDWWLVWRAKRCWITKMWRREKGKDNMAHCLSCKLGFT